jgi:hypothetical protein
MATYFLGGQRSAHDVSETYPGERSIILAEERREWRAGLGALVLVGGIAFASWLALSSPQDVADLADSVVPAAEAATLFKEQASPLSHNNGARPIELAQGSTAQGAAPAPQADMPLAQGDIIRLQEKLQSLGFDPGKADGHPGKRTLQALNAYRKSLGLQPVRVVDRQAVAPLTP